MLGSASAIIAENIYPGQQLIILMASKITIFATFNFFMRPLIAS
jgi:hypothetical protein